MKTLRRFVPGLVLGLTIAIAGVSFAQNANQATGEDKHSCCCATDSGSCQMMKKDGMKNHAASADKDGCCGCCGDSCQMMKKDGAKNHAASADKDGCCGCCGDSCQMMKKDAKNHAMAAHKEGGCCGDSCHMKDGAKTTTTTATAASDKHECCGDSCNMKHVKTEKP